MIILAVGLLLMGIGVWYAFSHKPQFFVQTKPKIAATIFPVFDITRNIVGDRAQVVQIIPPGASPHTFEVTPQTALGLQGVKAIFKIGSGLDDWIDDVAKSGSPDAPIFALSQRIDLRRFADGSVDPHYWLDLSNVQVIAKNISDAVSEIDPANKDYYQSNLAAYSKKLETADGEITGLLSNISQKNIATFHNAWYYFTKRYGLNVVTAFEPFPGKEPAPRYLAEFINEIKKYNLKVVFTEPQFSSQSLEQIAKDQGVALVLINPVDGGAAGDSDFISVLEDDARIMASVLK